MDVNRLLSVFICFIPLIVHGNIQNKIKAVQQYSYQFLAEPSLEFVESVNGVTSVLLLSKRILNVGTNYTLLCRVPNLENVPQKQISWFKVNDNFKYVKNSDLRKSSKADKLSLINVDYKDEGLYYCTSQKPKLAKKFIVIVKDYRKYERRKRSKRQLTHSSRTFTPMTDIELLDFVEKHKENVENDPDYDWLYEELHKIDKNAVNYWEELKNKHLTTITPTTIEDTQIETNHTFAYIASLWCLAVIGLLIIFVVKKSRSSRTTIRRTTQVPQCNHSSCNINRRHNPSAGCSLSFFNRIPASEGRTLTLSDVISSEDNLETNIATDTSNGPSTRALLNQNLSNDAPPSYDEAVRLSQPNLYSGNAK